MAARTWAMYSSSRVASTSIVAEMIGSVLGRQVAMAILRHTENGTDDVALSKAPIIGIPFHRRHLEPD